jgi:hypothetical protein
VDHCDLDLEIAISRYLFAGILRLIAELRPLPAVISTEVFDRLSPKTRHGELTNDMAMSRLMLKSVGRR